MIPIKFTNKFHQEFYSCNSDICPRVGEWVNFPDEQRGQWSYKVIGVVHSMRPHSITVMMDRD